MRVLEYMQEKAVFEHDEKQTIKAAAQPAHPLGKSIASVSLLAYITVEKLEALLPWNIKKMPATV